MLGLWLCGRLQAVVWWHGHWCGVTRQGRLIHFRHPTIKAAWWRKLWFRGQLELLALEALEPKRRRARRKLPGRAA